MCHLSADLCPGLRHFKPGEPLPDPAAHLPAERVLTRAAQEPQDDYSQRSLSEQRLGPPHLGRSGE